MPDSTPVEIWKPVPGFEGCYEVSDQGRVRSLDRQVIVNGGQARRYRGKILKPLPNIRSGYLYVCLRKNKESHRVTIHSLVLKAFIGPYPTGMECCHNNGNRTDNRFSNLRYDTSLENHRDIKRQGRNSYLNRATCKRGHPLDLFNTYYQPNGGRTCRQCVRESRRKASHP